MCRDPKVAAHSTKRSIDQNQSRGQLHGQLHGMTGLGMNIYLTIENLWKTFGSFTALREISLDVREGEFLCFLGPSGCGKTTLLRAIAGLDLQTSGTVVQAGKDVSNLSPSERDFGIVFQSYALFPNLTIEENIAFGLENAGRAKADVKNRVSELLDLVGLPDQGKKYPAQLSGGQQQRIALARAIATSPGLLLLDEPLSALDAKVRVHLRHEVKKLQRKLSVTTIMVTHDQEEALSMADRIVVMNHGIIEQVGTPTEIYGSPETLFVADFIGEMNQLDAAVEDSTSVKIGGKSFKCVENNFKPGQKVVAAIRPEDIVPIEAKGSGGNSGENTLSAKIDSLEFLGSFWRAHLSSAELGATPIVADFSINAMRRLDLKEQKTLDIDLPSARFRAFAPTNGGL